MKEGLEMAVEDINAAGGLVGRSVELVTYDLEDEAAEKVNAAADKLVMSDRVSVNITGYGGMGPDIPAFGKYPQPYLHFDGSALTVDMVLENKFQNIFMLGDVEAPYGAQTFDILTSLPYEMPNNKIVILAGDFEWDKKVTEGEKARAEEMGWDVAMYEVFPYGTREWGPVLTKIRAINPAIISISDLDPADIKTFLDQFIQEPANSLVEVGYAVSIPEFANIVGLAGNGVMGIATNSILPNAENDAWKQRFEQKFGHPPGLSILGTVYDGAMMWAEAVKKVGNPDDYKAVSDAIRTMNYVGLNGTYKFVEGGKVPASDETLPMHFFQVQNGKLVRLFVGTKKTADFVAPPWIKK
jgi:branched-chain amino acid transport system substrate-binding protein